MHKTRHLKRMNIKSMRSQNNESIISHDDDDDDLNDGCGDTEDDKESAAEAEQRKLSIVNDSVFCFVCWLV